MQKEEIKFQNSTVFEGMTSIRAIIKGRELGINCRRIEKILFDSEKIGKISKYIGYLRAVSKVHDFDIVESNAEEIEKYTIGNSHGGIIAIAGERKIEELGDASLITENGFYVMIQGIEDPYNFGYALRSLYACGVDGVILPSRNWMSSAGVVARSSAGASE
jgi:23S rRNA (guanosine2251-2'-O)-methyltransferase